MKILKQFYFIIEVFIIFFINNPKNFIIFTPRFFSFFMKKVLIFNVKKKKFFFQNIRNFYDINTVFQIFGYEEYNLNLHKKWKKTKLNFNKKFLIVDCGSNIGSSTRYFEELFLNSKIIAIEPDKKNFNLSKKNIINKKTKIINSAVASQNFYYKIINKNDPRAHQVKYKNNNTNNQTITINQILKLEKKFQPFLIKIDIEGFEQELFSKKIEWMDKFEIIIIEIHDWMLPTKSISSNFIRSLAKTLNKSKRDLIIRGENLISIKIP